MSITVENFLQVFQSSITEKKLVKLTLGAKRNKGGDLKQVFVKPVILKTGEKLCFVYRHNTNDITKNMNGDEAVLTIGKLLKEDFYNADLFSLTNDHHFLQDKDGRAKLVTKPASLSEKGSIQQHDKQKNRIIQTGNKTYLQQLGVTTAEGHVKKDMQDKYKQINRYVEIIDGIVKDLHFDKMIRVADMGSGKGYLTFALFDYLQHKLQLHPHVTGIELRNDLVDTCNQVAVASSFDNLQFVKGSIADSATVEVDMLIALHACDTATDDAIFRGIQANAKVIVCAPCCHKQIRKQMKPGNALSSITKHGILLERQAEIVTDSIRALLLEASGYKTKVFDFIPTEHTPKNVMIAAVKSETNIANRNEYLQKVKELKMLFNIEQHYLEKLLGD